MPLGGQVAKGKTLYNIGKIALAGGTLTGTQEAILHMQQDLRTAEESFMNIGIGTAIGGGIGVFGQVLNRRASCIRSIRITHSKETVSFEWVSLISVRAFENAVIQPIVKGGKKTFESPVGGSVSAAAREQLAKS